MKLLVYLHEHPSKVGKNLRKCCKVLFMHLTCLIHVEIEHNNALKLFLKQQLLSALTVCKSLWSMILIVGCTQRTTM